MGARSRVCPACGRGSLFVVLGQMGLLGVLLLGIGLASGLVPLQRLERAVGIGRDTTPTVVRPAQPPAPPRAAARRPRGASRKPAEPASVPVVAPVDSQPSVGMAARIRAAAPCASPDTEVINTLLKRPGPPDEGLIAAAACRQPAESPPDTAAESQSRPPPLFLDSFTGAPREVVPVGPPAY